MRTGKVGRGERPDLKVSAGVVQEAAGLGRGEEWIEGIGMPSKCATGRVEGGEKSVGR